ncbi:hypothetical protein [Mycolicibacterium sp. XJ870]
MSVVKIATGSRRFRTWVGRLPGGRRLIGGARPIEQVVAVLVCFTASGLAAIVFPVNALAALTVGAATGVGVAFVLSLIPYDNVPVTARVARLALLLVDRKPSVVAAEELARQERAGGAFLIADGEQPLNSVDPADATT